MKQTLALALALGSIAPLAFADINFPNFDDVSSLHLNGTTAMVFDPTAGVNKNVLRLTTSGGGNGSAFSENKVSLAGDASFSSFFSFRISDPQGGGADGIVFVVETVSNSVGGGGGGIGYQGIAKSVGVEFDTFDNGVGLGDPDGNHVAIDTNGNFDTLGTNVDSLGQLDQGGIFYAWVDYNGATDVVEARLNNVAVRPANPTVSRSLDIPAILGETQAFVGFTAATGGAQNNHDILSWGLTGAFNPFPGVDTTPRDAGVPEAAPFVPVLALGFGVTVWKVWRRRKQA